MSSFKIIALYNMNETCCLGTKPESGFIWKQFKQYVNDAAG